MTLIDLSRSELDDSTIMYNGVRYLEIGDDFYALAPTGKKGTRYTDADDRPWDHSHDGNGWTDRVQEFSRGERVEGELLGQLIYEMEWAATETSFSPASYLGTLPLAERTSRVIAGMQERLTLERGGYLTRRATRNPDGSWSAIPIQRATASTEDYDTL